MSAPLCYTGGVLDRAAHLRRDPAWLEARSRDPRSAVLPIWRDDPFILTDDPPRPVIITGERCAAFLERSEQSAFLGLDRSGAACFAADLSEQTQSEAARAVGAGVSTPLRRIGAALASGDAAVLAYARGLFHWHRRHRFCGVCGSPTASRDAGHLRACCSPACAAEHFPRTDPAVIMLITHRNHDGDRCLLARQPRFPRGMYSTLAGFVEPGESLEEAVARETLEETGLTVAGIRYRGSQPWPFPSSIMLAFTGEVVGDAAIAFDPEELQDARWFTRTDVADFSAAGLRLPSLDSVARRLVTEWLEEER